MPLVNADNLPIIDITKENCAEQWSSLITAVHGSSFIALDLEMSGLGNRKNLSLKSIEERYKTCCELASTYSILSLGVSCFQILTEGDGDSDGKKVVRISNKTFNILTLCDEEFLVEPKSLKFLISHGFDFNKLFKSGVDYYRGNDKIDGEPSTIKKQYVRDLITEISASKRPIVLHNGFIDLIFLYQNFYAKCPGNSMKFLADLEEIFAGGVYDTKYISDFHAHSSASFLEYLYNKALYENGKLKSDGGNKHIELVFDFNSTTLDDFRIKMYGEAANPESVVVELKLCSTYSIYGYCPKIETCQKSHDVNLIIQTELNAELRKKKKRSKLNPPVAIEDPNINEVIDSIETKVVNQAHNAGLDAFMTGYAMLNYINKFTKFKLDGLGQGKIVEFCEISQLEEKFRNNVYLVGKDYPLCVTKGNYTTTSVGHRDKKEKLLNDRNTFI